MIRSFRHRGLEKYYSTGSTRGLPQDMVARIRRVLSVLDSAAAVEDMDLLPGMRLHPLKGDLAGYWSVSLSGNWRIIFKFENGEANRVDLVDYH
jgi:proteic killer suppression protein